MKLSREDAAHDMKKRTQVIEPEQEELLWEKISSESITPNDLSIQ